MVVTAQVKRKMQKEHLATKIKNRDSEQNVV